MKNVEIYTGPMCIFCDWAKELLEKKGVAFKEIYIGDDPKKDIEGAKGAGIQAINIHELATLNELLEKVKETLIPAI